MSHEKHLDLIADAMIAVKQETGQSFEEISTEVTLAPSVDVIALILLCHRKWNAIDIVEETDISIYDSKDEFSCVLNFFDEKLLGRKPPETKDPQGSHWATKRAQNPPLIKQGSPLDYQGDNLEG